MKLNYKVGDKVRVTTKRESNDTIKVGDVGVITQLHELTRDPHYSIDFGKEKSGIWWFLENEIELTTISQFKIGDRVQVTEDICTYVSKGDIGTIEKIFNVGQPNQHYLIDFGHERHGTWYANHSKLQLATKESKMEPLPFKIGDRVVRTSDGHDYTSVSEVPVGTQGTVLAVDPISARIQWDNGKFGWLSFPNIKKAMDYKFKVGDKVKAIVDRPNGAHIKKDEVVTIVELYPNRTSYRVVCCDGIRWSVNQDLLELAEVPKTNEYTVSGEFIKEAHKAACSEWKRKLEAKFPDVFRKPTLKALVEEYGKEIDFVVSREKLKPEFESGSNQLSVELPHDNYKWSKAVYEWSFGFCEFCRGKDINAYPVHSNAHKMIIEVDSSKLSY